tara:strand:+ start:296 stop:760 length:465 start_codon:yes stop_codon:yes gene_type:complete
MNFLYYNLPFGAQLLLWTSRLAFYGSCRTSPNKYELIDVAYKKAGMNNGSILLKKFLSSLKDKESFKLQPMCEKYLIKSEIDLINCIQEHRKIDIDNKYFIKIWQLEKNIKAFTVDSINLATALKKANLNTNMKCYQPVNNNFNKLRTVNETLH